MPDLSLPPMTLTIFLPLWSHLLIQSLTALHPWNQTWTLWHPHFPPSQLMMLTLRVRFPMWLGCCQFFWSRPCYNHELQCPTNPTGRGGQRILVPVGPIFTCCVLSIPLIYVIFIKFSYFGALDPNLSFVESDISLWECEEGFSQEKVHLSCSLHPLYYFEIDL